MEGSKEFMKVKTQTQRIIDTFLQKFDKILVKIELAQLVDLFDHVLRLLRPLNSGHLDLALLPGLAPGGLLEGLGRHQAFQLSIGNLKANKSNQNLVK